MSFLDLKEMETVTLKKRKIVVSNAQLKKKAYPLIASIESPPSTNDDRASSSSRSCCGSPSFSGVTHCLSVSLSVCPWLFLSLHPIEAWGHYFVLEGPEEGVVALTSCTSLLTRPVFQLDWVRRGTSDLQKCGGVQARNRLQARPWSGRPRAPTRLYQRNFTDEQSIVVLGLILMC